MVVLKGHALVYEQIPRISQIISVFYELPALGCKGTGGNKLSLGSMKSTVKPIFFTQCMNMRKKLLLEKSSSYFFQFK